MRATWTWDTSGLLIQVDGFLYAKLFAIFISILVEFEDHRIALKMIFMPFFVFDGSLPDLTIFIPRDAVRRVHGALRSNYCSLVVTSSSISLGMIIFFIMMTSFFGLPLV